MSIIGKDITTYVALIGYTITLVAWNETLQIADTQFHNPYGLCYIITIEKALLAVIPIPIWKCYRSYFGLSTKIIREEKEYNSIFWFHIYSILIGILICGTTLTGVMSSGIHMTTVPTATAIGRLEPIPILLLSVLYLKQKFTVRSIIVMVVALTGLLFYVLELSSSNHIHDNKTYDTSYGIILCLITTFGYAIACIVNKQMSNYCYEQNKFMISSILAVAVSWMSSAILFFWIPFYPETLDFSLLIMDAEAFTWILLVGGIGFLLDVLRCLVIALTDPFYVSVASALTIPLAFVVDVYIHDYKFNVYAILGALFITVSFVMLEMNKHCSNIKCASSNLIKETDNGLLLDIVENRRHYGATSREM